MNILQTIFTDYFEHIEYELHPRPAVMDNVSKMIHCGAPSYGGAMYGCPHCGNLKFVPFRCHSRFCPSCGNKYNQVRFHLLGTLFSECFSKLTKPKTLLRASYAFFTLSGVIWNGILTSMLSFLKAAPEILLPDALSSILIIPS